MHTEENPAAEKIAADPLPVVIEAAADVMIVAQTFEALFQGEHAAELVPASMREIIGAAGKALTRTAEHLVLASEAIGRKGHIAGEGRDVVARMQWLSEEPARLEDVRGRVNNEGCTVQQAIDFFRIGE